jgi:hypothetical protein
MTQKCWLVMAMTLACVSAVSADYRCWSPPVCYYVYACPDGITSYALRPATPATPARSELAPPPRSTPRASSATAPAANTPASPSRLPSNFLRDYAPEAPAASPIEPSSAPRKPEASEERKHYYDAYFVAGDPSAVRQVSEGSRSVCFWNLSPSRLTLQVEGKAYTLDRDKKVTLDLPREFTWQVNGRAAESTAFEDDRTAMEIVIRR